MTSKPALAQELGFTSGIPAAPLFERTQNGNSDSRSESIDVEKLYEGSKGELGNIIWQSQYPSDLKESRKSESAAIVLRYQRSTSVYGGGPLELHSITIRDRLLRETIQEILAGLPGVSTAACDLTIDRPFEPFFFRWKSLEKSCSSETKSEPRRLLKCVFQYLEPELSTTLTAAPALIDRDEITFELLWTIFPAGAVTISEYDGDNHLYLVSKTQFKKDADRNNVFAVDLVYLDYDGRTHGWRDTTVNIREFVGIKRIAELETTPIEHADVPDSEIQRLTDRGKKACLLATGGYKSHRGKATTLELSRETGRLYLVETFVEGRIIIDVEEYTNNQQYDRLKTATIPTGLAILAGVKRSEPTDTEQGFLDNLLIPQYNGYMPGDPYANPSVGKALIKPTLQGTQNVDDLLSAHQWTNSAVGIPPEAFYRGAVRGYCLSTKSWATFRVDNISEIKWNDNAFDRLVMSEARKALIKAAVEEQSRNKTDHDDIVEGKGQGLIMLFSGSPGTGKTLTAESIADILRLPLYSVDASQLGDTTEEIERKLRSVLRLVASWEAVLLLDEADVFMGKRVNDLQASKSNQRVAGKPKVLAISLKTLLT